MPPTLQQTAAGYAALWARAAINPGHKAAALAAARQILARRTDYAAIEAATGVPLVFVGPVHYRECSLRFDRHLHCGDPLTARTVRVPKGRPRQGVPPFTFAESAIDALTMPPHALHKVGTWSLERLLYEAERYNGWGYLGKGNSPYLWAGTSEYVRGKYVADHVYDANAVDRQLGCVAIMKALAELDPVIASQLGRRETKPPPDVVAERARPARTAQAGGIATAGGGVAAETANQLNTSTQAQAPQPAEQFIPAWMPAGLVCAGLAIALIAAAIARRRLAFLMEKWSGAPVCAASPHSQNPGYRMFDKIWNWCRQSATIAFARVQLAAGVLIGVLNELVIFVSGTNAHQFLPPRWLMIYLIFSGVVTELARRRTLAS